MIRNSLVIIPTTKPQYTQGFSAPLAWLFTDNLDAVHGVYSWELNKSLVQSYEYFIIELNWFTTLFEVFLIVDYIKYTNQNARIMIGGLYSSLKYRELFKELEIDYFIKGDNELPMKAFLQGDSIQSIPNLVSKNNDPDISWTFSSSDYDSIRYSIDWFPMYKSSYVTRDLFKDAIPFALPMIITTKGCKAAHTGCDYCMGSKSELLKTLYNRNSLSISDLQLSNMLGQLERDDLKLITIYILSDIENYSFAGNYDLDVYIEIDSKIKTLKSLQKIRDSFKTATVQIPIYTDGIMGGNFIENVDDYISLITDKFNIVFTSYSDLAQENPELFEKVQGRLIPILDTVFAKKPFQFNSYANLRNAYATSKQIYENQTEPKFSAFTSVHDLIDEGFFEE